MPLFKVLFGVSRVSLYGYQKFLSVRRYSEFFKDLPNALKLPLDSPSKVSAASSSTTEKPTKHNRFAAKYSKQNRKHDAPKPKSPDRRREDSPDLVKENAYENARRVLREKEKVRTISKKPSTPSISPRMKLKAASIKAQKLPKKVRKEKVKISVPSFITVSNLATIMNIPLNDLLKKVEDLGFENMSHNYILDKENASLIADEYNIDILVDDEAGADLFPSPECEDPSKLVSRPPIVTIMGHVDHGKTTILDYLRKSSIVSSEHGGITQHIGAFSVTTPISKSKITFLDTPGHSAFLKMRERGAVITDIVILVVAADDSIMPQTIEAIKHAKKFNVPMVVAINKCDKPGINIDKVLADLSSQGIDIEDYGGEVQTVKVSGKTGLNMEKLEEAVIALSEMHDFKAEPDNIPSEGWIIESQLSKGLGSTTSILVKRGTLKVGNVIVAGTTYCKVRGMKDENGKVLKSAGPSTPVQVWGWKQPPVAGDRVLQAKDEKFAKMVCENRINREKLMKTTEDIEIINKQRQEEIKELKRQEMINELKMAGFTEDKLEEEFEEKEPSKVIVKYMVKADVFGSAEAIKESIDGLGNEEVQASVLSYEAGAATESDIETALAVGAKILCFNSKVPKQIQMKAEKKKVEIKEYNIIYRLIEDVTENLTSLLKPRIEIKSLGEVKIQGIFNITSKNKSKTKVAGCKVTSGSIKRSSRVKVLRNGKVVYEGELSSLKHVKDDISEAKKGTECGVSFGSWEKFEVDDIIQPYEEVLHERYL